MMGRPSEDARSHSVANRGGKSLRQINAKTAPAWGRRGRQTSGEVSPRNGGHWRFWGVKNNVVPMMEHPQPSRCAAFGG
jgi:hypothetical protein